MKVTFEDISVAMVAYNCYIGGATIKRIADKCKYSQSKILKLIKAVNYGKTGFNTLPI